MHGIQHRPLTRRPGPCGATGRDAGRGEGRRVSRSGTRTTAEGQPGARRSVVLLVLAAVQFTNIVDFMIIMPLGQQLMRTLRIDDLRFGRNCINNCESRSVRGARRDPLWLRLCRVRKMSATCVSPWSTNMFSSFIVNSYRTWRVDSMDRRHQPSTSCSPSLRFPIRKKCPRSQADTRSSVAGSRWPRRTHAVWNR